MFILLIYCAAQHFVTVKKALMCHSCFLTAMKMFDLMSVHTINASLSLHLNAYIR